MSTRLMPAIIFTACAILCGFSQARAEAASPSTAPATAPAGTGVIKGKVVDSSGAKVEGATVLLLPDRGKLRERAKAGPSQPKADPTAALPQKIVDADPGAADTGKGRRPESLAKTTTDADGTFTFTGLAPGDYIVMAFAKGAGRGHEPVTVSSDTSEKSATPITITLQARGARNNG